MSIFAAIFGLLVGSFLNVLSDRLPNNQNVLWGRSHCDHCKKPLRFYELIPVFSYLLLRGRCARCKKTISVQYPVVELVTAIGFVVLYSLNSTSVILYISSCVIFSAFLVMFVADYKYQIIPDSMVVIGIIGTLATLFSLYPYGVIAVHIACGAGAFLFFTLLYLITKKRGIGFGDVKLSFLLGLLLGYPEVLIALYVAFLTGAMAGVILILGHKKSMKSKIAFGPFLIFGAMAAFVFHQQLLQLWYRIF